jgi:hypothetical protein
MTQSLTKQQMLEALQALAKKLKVKGHKSLTLIVGGGGALLLSDRFPLATSDIDAVPRGLSPEILNELVKEVALEMDLAPDWLNPWFSSFTHVLPPDFETRLIEVFHEPPVQALALGSEDLLLMKCFAHRTKDMAHARALVRLGIDLDLVESRILELKKRQIPKAKEALDFLDEVLNLEDSGD